ncbi:DUF294 nucleotidyltransferase-like domain-containing protein [Arthrobacter sp. NEB 688]|uniref:DUF294 nucleotidyltransferase-like domain-containing protein n=1 Tax=Arthrobacter sp. NEB 688 TaxID=904039 RepID=UPI0015659E12|nr:DUF294 nucleotidyltransferase-like domain-containing protein [Arthrobacter sp. NEB 688]QKE83376.1 cyclic nucleotide-binding/CBS domain-containing protein [Arthrobacter sp. NEB 688]
MPLDVELAEVRDFLAAHEPFAGLPPRVLAGLPARMSLEYVRRGRELVARGQENHHLHVLRSGAADVRDAEGTLVDRGEPGSSFGSITLTQGTPSTFSVTAIEDCLVLLLPEDDFHALCREHPAFDAFFDAQRRHRMRGAVAGLHVSASGHAILTTPVHELVARDVVSVPATASIREAAATMTAERVSSLVVLDAGRLVGILTDRDLRSRVLAAGTDPGSAVADVMTPHPVTAPAESLAFEALLTMTSRHIHHLPLVDAAGRPAGVVTTTDLLRLEEANPVYLAGDVARQPDVEGVARAASRLPRVVEGLVGQDASAEDIGRVVTAVGDAVERRLIALVEEEMGPAPVPYCWLALGSRGRLEQALASDQDTALVIDDAVDDAGLAWFATFAERVTEALVRCGLPRCSGGVMASNPRWRRTLRGWRRELSSWVTTPTPEAVLHSSIVFDLRPVHGDASLHARLQQHVLAVTPSAPTFLAHLARQATEHEPPLGFFRGLVLEKAGEHRDRLEVKRGGILPVVELARVHALATGSPALTTRARLEDARLAGALADDLADDLRDAFEFLGYVRLRHQSAQVRDGRPPDDFVDPGTLSSFEKRHLREAFAIVRSAQQALGRRHHTRYVS